MLSTSYSPDKPVGRESEINRIAEAVTPLLRNRSSENLLVYGPAGVGKSTCVKHVLDALDEQGRVRSAKINCWQYNTRPALLTELLIQLGYPAPRKGKPVDELLSTLQEWLDKNRSVALALDEFDQLKAASEVIYDLNQLNRDTDHKLGLVMVSNRPPSKLYLDPRSRSRLNCQTLRFDPYDVTQLQQVLQARVEHAFYSGAVSDAVIKMIAEQIAEQSGDCRDALQVLLQAAQKAEQADIQKLTVDWFSGDSEFRSRP